MNLTFVYLRKDKCPWESAMSDGYFILLRELVRRGVLTSARFLIDCWTDPPERRDIAPGMVLEKVNGLDGVELEPGAAVWIRAGWKTWIPWIEKQHNAGHWLLFYGAGVPHHAWPFWDVVLDDTNAATWVVDDRGRFPGRLCAHFRKALSPFFRFIPVKRDYDFCLGANFIYGRKGQDIAYAALHRYTELTGTKPRAIMPGGLRRGEVTYQILREVERLGDLEIPGHLPRAELADRFNRSKVFMHLGTSTQGDRGPIEAGRTGCQLLLGHRRRHATYLFNAPIPPKVPVVERDLTEIAGLMAQAAAEDTDDLRQLTSAYFVREDGLGDVGSLYLTRILDVMRENPQADRALLRKVFSQ